MRKRERLAMGILGLSTACHALVFMRIISEGKAFPFVLEILILVSLAYTCAVVSFFVDTLRIFGPIHAAGGLLALFAIAILSGRMELAEALLVIPFIAMTSISLKTRIALGVDAVFAGVVLVIDVLCMASAGVSAVLFHLLPILLVMCATAGFGCLLTFYREIIVQDKALIADLDAAVANLTNANKAFQSYANRIETASRDDERNRITRELHDIIGYALTNLIMMMNAGETLVRNNPEQAMRGDTAPCVTDRLNELFQKARSQADSALQESRKILYKLRSIATPPPESLLHALNHLASSFQAATGVEVTTHYGNLPWSYGESIDSAIFRLIQEGLTNSFTHGRARKVRILLWQARAEVLIRVWDDGRGAEEITEGIGLSGMRERFAALGGRVETSNTFDGFVLDASIPMGETQHEDN